MDRGGRRRQAQSYYSSAQDPRSIVVERAYCQADGSGGRTLIAATTTRQKRQRITPRSLDDEYSSWTPFNHELSPDDDQYQAGDISTVQEDPGMTEETDAGRTEGVDAGQKRKFYTSSDDPNTAWRNSAVNILHELLRLDGLGDFLASPCCSMCGVGYPVSDDQPVRLFRCEDCHILLQCTECCLDAHRMHPLHNIQEYNGIHFSRVWLADLGLEYQLGHGGMSCSHPDPLLRKIVVLHTNGVHQINYRYCDCVVSNQPSHMQQILRNRWYPATPTEPRTCATFQCMDLFRLLNVAANINANDFIDVLERLTNFTNPDSVPDRYLAFSRMVRQWAFLLRCKRSGVAMTLKSIDDITPGSLALRCWGCPWDGINLPAGWDKVDAKYSYLYMPILCLDANFRLKNRFRPNERPDPSIAPGSAYFVASKPYKEFLSKYVSKKDVSTCIAFAALLLKDTKLTTGLRTSGVAGCACARHELIRPQGIGDLQKGERYANMDYVLFSALQFIKNHPHIGLSYDIICQFKVHLLDRMQRLPPQLHLSKECEFTFGLPVWHTVVHELSCKSTNALSYQGGVGRTDGEGIERIWSLLNPSSYATKQMSEGKRHDTLDDRIDFHNITKNLGHGYTLARRLKVALVERDKQIESFRVADMGLNPEVRAEHHWVYHKD